MHTAILFFQSIFIHSWISLEFVVRNTQNEQYRGKLRSLFFWMITSETTPDYRALKLFDCFDVNTIYVIDICAYAYIYIFIYICINKWSTLKLIFSSTLSVEPIVSCCCRVLLPIPSFDVCLEIMYRKAIMHQIVFTFRLHTICGQMS